jgi:hypothetical protein
LGRKTLDSGGVLNLDVSVLGFGRNNSSKSLVRVLKKNGPARFGPLPDAFLVPKRHSEDTSASRKLRVSAATRLGRLGKPFVDFLLVGEQLLDARALLHGEEIKVRLLQAVEKLDLQSQPT